MKISIFFVLCFFICCNDKSTSVVPPANTIPYTDFLANLLIEKKSNVNPKTLFFSFINSDVPSYWTGTLWDFNGTTRQPKKGNIACGYFVTNVLTDFGFDIKRVYLAQQASSVMIKQLSEASSVKHFSNKTQVINYLKARSENEIYLVGLDFHTGFVIRENDHYYFLHSNYIDRSGVMKEELDESEAFLSSKTYMIGSLSENAGNFN